jgi:tyrosine-specific transport protein
MKSKIFGGVLLIVGTCLGAGMLALPLVTAAGGFVHSLWLFLGIWLLTVFAAFLILEVNLWCPEDSNLISMARATLGWPGQMVTWLVYLLLLYCLLSAYISGGSDLLHSIFSAFHLQTAVWFDSVLFTFLLSLIVYRDIATVDWANRTLMVVKMTAYLALVILIVPHVHVQYLEGGHYALLSGAVMVVITAFGYSIIIPSLRRYFDGNVNALRLTIALGSVAALLCYLFWDFVVQGSLMTQGEMGLIHMAVSGHATSQLTSALSVQLGSAVISEAAHVFTAVCVTTSFLGVALCLSDFLTDGMRMGRRGWQRFLVIVTTFLPPLLLVLIFPGAFISGLRYAGIFCVFLLLLVPALMVWSGRYIKKMAVGYQVWGGGFALLLAALASIALLIYGARHLL